MCRRESLNVEMHETIGAQIQETIGGRECRTRLASDRLFSTLRYVVADWHSNILIVWRPKCRNWLTPENGIGARSFFVFEVATLRSGNLILPHNFRFFLSSYNLDYLVSVFFCSLPFSTSIHCLFLRGRLRLRGKLTSVINYYNKGISINRSLSWIALRHHPRYAYYSNVLTYNCPF